MIAEEEVKVPAPPVTEKPKEVAKETALENKDDNKSKSVAADKESTAGPKKENKDSKDTKDSKAGCKCALL